MMHATMNLHEIGKKIEIKRIPALDIEFPINNMQPAIIKRVITRQEYIDYWINEIGPEKFREQIRKYGQIPDYLNFYEVSID